MKKSLLLASVAMLGLSAAAQGVDPATYEVVDGYQLENLWMMSIGTEGTIVASDDFKALPLGNMQWATSAIVKDGKIYISCGQQMHATADGEGQALDHYPALVVLDAANGKYIKTIPLTVDGKELYGTGSANSLTKDDYGHVCVSSMAFGTYNDDTNVAGPINLYTVDTETGALTLVNAFTLDEIDGPGHGGRVDFTTIRGDVTGKEARAIFMCAPNSTFTIYAWSLEQGEDKWHLGSYADAEYAAFDLEEPCPSTAPSWGLQPIVSPAITDGELDGTMFYVDAQQTIPALYDAAGLELIDKFDTTVEEGTTNPMAEYIPQTSENGIYQFDFNGEQFLAYAMKFPGNGGIGGHIALVKLDPDEGMAAATPLWKMPANGMSDNKGRGQFVTSISLDEIVKDENEKLAVNILVYRESAGIALYRFAQEGYQAGQGSIAIDTDNNAPVEYFNLYGVRVDRANLAPGLYISRQGNKATKVVVK